MKKNIMILGVIVLTVLAGIFVLHARRASMVRDGLQSFLEKLTGVQVEMTLPSVNSSMTEAKIQNLKVLNPKGYDQPVLAELQDIELHCKFLSGMSGSGVPCSLVRAKLVEANFERHQLGGKFNVKDLKVFSDAVLNQPSSPKGSFSVARYELSFGRASIYEYGDAAAPQKTESDLGGRTEVYSRITDPAVLIYAPVLRILPEFKRGNMSLPRSILQKKLTEALAA